MKFNKSWILVLIHIVLIIETIKNKGYFILWVLYSVGGLFWIIGYETGWHDRCCCKKHRLRKETNTPNQKKKNEVR